MKKMISLMMDGRRARDDYYLGGYGEAKAVPARTRDP
jgi:hypothetical protein